MPVVRMPNGDKVRFPDDMPADEIKHLILKKFPDVHKDTTTDHLVHGARTFARAGSLGLADKASKGDVDKRNRKRW